jgi:hypothetical protein
MQNITYANFPVGPTSITTSGTNYKILGCFLGSSGVVTNAPQAQYPISYGNGNVAFEAKFRINYIELMLNFVGSQATALASGDLFNRVRVVVVRASTPYSGSSAISPDIDSGLDLRDVKNVYLDQIVNLSSTAFDSSSGYNCPATKTLKRRIQVNRVFEAYSNTTPYTTWDTREQTIAMYVVSDSSITPNPVVSGHIRCFYSFL